MDKERYAQYLEALERLLSDWKRYRKTITAAQMVQNRDDCHKACHVMFLAIQTAIDIAHLVVADRGYVRPGSNRECFEVLSQEGFLRDKNLAKSLSDLASFRNVLVHQYHKLNPRRAHDNLKQGLKALESYQKVVARSVLKG